MRKWYIALDILDVGIYVGLVPVAIFENWFSRLYARTFSVCAACGYDQMQPHLLLTEDAELYFLDAINVKSHDAQQISDNLTRLLTSLISPVAGKLSQKPLDMVR